MPTRRTFIQTVAAMAAVPPPEPLLPTVKFGKTEITRMIIGSNPFYGYSHFNRILDAAMREYYTPERRVEVLLACERQASTPGSSITTTSRAKTSNGTAPREGK